MNEPNSQRQRLSTTRKIADLNTCLANGFRSVDTVGDFKMFSSCLERLESMECFAAYKTELSNRLTLPEGGRVLDVGCGLGFDVIRLAQHVGKNGLALGVDASAELLGLAKRTVPAGLTQASYLFADAHRLGLASNSFDAARIDRALQHVERPEQVIKEMCRVVRAGGVVACAEPDWESFTITADDYATTRLVSNTWCDRFRHGWIGRELSAHLARAGLQERQVTGHLIIAEGMEEIDGVFDLTRTVEGLRRLHVTEAPRLSRWMEQLLRRDQAGTLSATVTVFCVSGFVP